MHDALYENEEELGPPLYLALAESLDLAAADLTEALEQHSFRQKVRADFAGGLKSGVNGTPTFYINGTRHDGSFELEDLVAAIDAALEDIKLQA
jgi:protein-disulfide isomerase